MVNLAQIISEIGPLLERGPIADQLAAEVGMAHVTRASGKAHRRLPTQRQLGRPQSHAPLRRQ
ncbi:hypothetical protein ABT294_21180 [Nonomuraea sp. NPDC000554]|uniref:hypothetical protein n=1 Tax=Nonomuraea sp. NPDC000554 TaxID=3154259 RepID=UPI0033297DEE